MLRMLYYALVVMKGTGVQPMTARAQDEQSTGTVEQPTT